MGMFDTINNNYDLGPGFNSRILQTKDLSYMMGNYFLDHVGCLWEIDCSGTYDFREDTGEFKWVKNGNRGKCKPYSFTGIIKVYPHSWDCKYSPFPECKLLFRKGILEVVTHIIKSK
jgi:hypothetical protein